MSIASVQINPSYRSKKIEVTVELGVRATGTVSLRITDAHDRLAAEQTVQTSGDGATRFAVSADELVPWEPEHPVLYTAEVAAGAGKSVQLRRRFGYREMWTEGRDFFLNGRLVHLRPVLAAKCDTREEIARAISNYRQAGFTIAEIWPGPNVSPEFIDTWCSATDELGFMIAAPVGRVWEYLDTWSDPETRASFVAKTRDEMLAVHHHPSLVMWATNGNTFGSSLNMDPCGIGRRRDAWHELGYFRTRREAAGHDVTRIFHELDPSRPMFMHHGGGIGDVHTLNMYLNLAPLQEREEWLSRWAYDGELPLLIVEFGTPVHVSFTRARTDFGGGIHSEPLVTEYCAIYLGKRAYELETEAYRQEIADTHVAGEHYRRWHLNPLMDAAPALQELEQLFLRNTWRSWRTHGISGGMIPWNDGHGWLERPHKGPEDILPAGRTLIENNGPTLAWIAGARDATPRDAAVFDGRVAGALTAKDHLFRPGERVHKTVVLLSELASDATWSVAWSVTVDGETVALDSTTGSIDAGSTQTIDLSFVLSKGQGETSSDATISRGSIELVARIGDADHRDRFPLSVVREDASTENALPSTCYVFDPEGRTGKLLRSLGLEPADWSGSATDNALIVIGERALGDRAPVPAGIEAAVRDGARLVIVGQTREWLRSRGFRIAGHLSRRVYRIDESHPVVDGISDDELRDWRGESSMLEAYPCANPEQTRLAKWWFPYHGFHWSNRGSVSSAAVEKPHRAGWRPILECEFDLAYSPLLELFYGRGSVTLCTLDLVDRSEQEPVANLLFERVVRYAAAGPAGGQPSKGPREERGVTLLGDDEDAELLESLGVRFDRASSLDDVPPASLLVVGRLETPDESALREHLRGGGPALFLRRFRVSGPFGLRYVQRRLSAGSLDPPPWPECAGLSASDLRYRAPHNNWCVDEASAGWETGADGLIARRSFGRGVAVAVQIDPTLFDADLKRYFRITRWRATRALSQVFANLGATFEADSSLFAPPEVARVSLSGTWHAYAQRQRDPIPRLRGEPRPAGTPDVTPPRVIEPAASDAERDAAEWAAIDLPGPWERQDSRWNDTRDELILKRTIEIPRAWIGRNLIVSLGKIDDSDHTYWNGHRIDVMEEKGRWPHNMPRVYEVPAELVTEETARLVIHLYDRANTYDRVWGGGFIGPASEMWITVREAGLYAADYRYDYVYGDDPYRYFNW